MELAGGGSSDLAPPHEHPVDVDVPASIWTALWLILAFVVLSAGVVLAP